MATRRERVSEYLTILDGVIEDLEGTPAVEHLAHARAARRFLETATDVFWAEAETASVSPSTLAMQATAFDCLPTCGARH